MSGPVSKPTGSTAVTPVALPLTKNITDSPTTRKPGPFTSSTRIRVRMPSETSSLPVNQHDNPRPHSAGQCKYDPTVSAFQPQQQAKEMEVCKAEVKDIATKPQHSKLVSNSESHQSQLKKSEHDMIPPTAASSKLSTAIQDQHPQKSDLQEEVSKLKTENQTLQRRCQDLEADQAKLRQAFETMKTSLAERESVINSCNERNEKQQKKLNKRNLEAAQGRVLSVGKDGAVGLQQNIALGHKAMEELRGQLVRAQPIADQPDDSIKDLYEKLCDSITHLVERKFRGVHDSILTVERMAQDHNHSAILLQMLPQHAVRAVTRFPTCDGVVLKGVLWRLIWTTVFGRQSMFARGLDSATEALYMTVDAMLGLVPVRVAQNIHYWRAEGFRALKDSAAIQETQQSAIDHVAIILAEICCEIKPEEVDSNVVRKSIDKCLAIAVSLEWALRCSTKSYLFDDPEAAEGRERLKDIAVGTLDHCHVVNAAKGALMDKADCKPLVDGGHIGRMLMGIYPELRVKRTDEDSSTMISKATILATIDADSRAGDEMAT